jgi:hypothetical protein
MAVNNNILYWGSGRVMKITDISTPQSPNDLGNLVLDSIVMDIATSAGTAYVATRRQGFGIVDVSDPAEPQLQGWFSGSGGGRRPSGFRQPRIFRRRLFSLYSRCIRSHTSNNRRADLV